MRQRQKLTILHMHFPPFYTLQHFSENNKSKKAAFRRRPVVLFYFGGEKDLIRVNS